MTSINVIKLALIIIFLMIFLDLSSGRMFKWTQDEEPQEQEQYSQEHHKL